MFDKNSDNNKYQEHGVNYKKYLFIGILIILIIIALALAVKYYNSQTNSPANSGSQEKDLSQKEVIQESNHADLNNKNNKVDKNLERNSKLNNNETELGEYMGDGPMVADQDMEGLYDFEEEKIGTNPKNRDTDNDGLDDYYEIRIYRTDPLSSDTDGDGYSDGEEVRSGYNPNGEGMLKNY
ncbi:hypothetical protein KAS41_04230 [Candidatus Parcubacteria bacterium]|nr:hypothetical protein [Candidatus Parcubacteria bacterium]